MNESSMVLATCRFIAFSTGSESRVSIEPPRSSSQLGPHSMVSIWRPSVDDVARATGMLRSPAGAVSSLSYS